MSTTSLDCVFHRWAGLRLTPMTQHKAGRPIGSVYACPRCESHLLRPLPWSDLTWCPGDWPRYLHLQAEVLRQKHRGFCQMMALSASWEELSPALVLEREILILVGAAGKERGLPYAELLAQIPPRLLPRRLSPQEVAQHTGLSPAAVSP